MVDKVKVACVSGHRRLPQDCTELQANLEKAIVELIERGVVFFGNGAALGFDQMAAETVMRLKEGYPHIRLVMVLPCPPEQQSLKWNDEQKKRYYKMLEQAHMVDCSAYLICYLREQRGGTVYTVNYAERQGLKILRL